jgi:hypothetical protein
MDLMTTEIFSLENVVVSEKVYKGLELINHKSISSNNDEYDNETWDEVIIPAIEWLKKNHRDLNLVVYDEAILNVDFKAE